MKTMKHRHRLFAFDSRTFDSDGHLKVPVSNISKASVNPYYGREIPGYGSLGLDADRVYYLYRDPVELERAAPSFAGKPLLMKHQAISAATPAQELWAGAIGSDVRFEPPYLRASLSVWTDEAIALIESRQQDQLSCAYRYRADMTPGVSPDGERFDGTMRDIEANHVALVEEGRAGPDVVVGDAATTRFSLERLLPYAASIKQL